jgi:hypothetical protein
MPTLAPKLPYTHPFAGGYPRLGGQPLPTDPDAIDYLNRVAAVEAPVEVGVAMAVDAFVRGCKADGTWSALQASCIMCGARTISGALVPLKGTAPTPYNFASGDYSRTTGLKGDGSTKYLDSNRANDADGQDDQHAAAYVSSQATATSGIIGSRAGFDETGSTQLLFVSGSGYSTRVHSQTGQGPSLSPVGFYGAKRSVADSFDVRIGSNNYNYVAASQTPNPDNIHIFQRSGAINNVPTDARLAFYSIGSAIPDLAALDNRVSTLVAAIAAAI